MKITLTTLHDNGIYPRAIHALNIFVIRLVMTSRPSWRTVRKIHPLPVIYEY
jgi:hypothetical protein